jgi:hypothetical protein
MVEKVCTTQVGLEMEVRSPTMTSHGKRGVKDAVSEKNDAADRWVKDWAWYWPSETSLTRS